MTAAEDAVPGVSSRVRAVLALADTARRVSDAAREAGTWTAPDRHDFLREVDRTITALTTARASVLLAERDAGTWRGSGDASLEAWRSRTSGSGMRAAGSDVRRGEALRGLPQLHTAAEAGEVSVVHVDVVARIASRATPPVREALASADGQARLLTMARRMDAGRFERSAAHWVAEIDRTSLEGDHQAQRAGRYLQVVDARDGTRITGRLDRMAGHRLRLALEAVAGRPAADDDRPQDVRRADALETLADTMLSLPETGSGAAVRPHVSFLMCEETWAALRSERRGRRAAAPALDDASRPGTRQELRAPQRRAPVTLEDGTPVPESEVARVLCDCELTRVVTDAASAPVDLGRTARLFTGEQRRAVIARDRGCAWPGCGAAPRWCEVHHVRWWDRDGGETSVDCGALVCSFHHHEIHRRDLALQRHMLARGQAPPGSGSARYVITAPDGTIVADGRSGSDGPDGWMRRAS